MAQNPPQVTLCSKNDLKSQPTGTIAGLNDINITLQTTAGELTFKRADFDFCQPKAPPAECTAGQLPGATGCVCPINQIMSGGRCVAPQQTCFGVKKSLETSTNPVILLQLAKENECPELRDALETKALRLVEDNGKGIEEPKPEPAPPGPLDGKPAIDMTKGVQVKIANVGKTTTRRAIEKTREFRHGDLYPFIIDFYGTEFANGGIPAIRGQNVLNLEDDTGKLLVRGLIDLAKPLPKGEGRWYRYRWPNPNTYNIEDKWSWVERLEDNTGLVGVGVYKHTNENTVRVISGSLNSDDIYLPMASDMADVLNDHHVRVLPMVTTGGPAQNIEDVRSLERTEIGLTQTGILNNFLENSKRFKSENKIVYIAKLFNEEVHLVASDDITSIKQLSGKTVNIGTEGSGTPLAMRHIFRKLNIDVVEVSMPQAEALKMVKSRQIAATALVAAKPVRSISGLTAASGLHLVPIPFSKPLEGEYLATPPLTREDYPDLIPAGQPVDTVGVGVVLITYDWPKTNDRYPRIERFVEEFFKNINELKKPPHHPKWREVDLAATLPGWTRFEPARELLDRQRETSKSGN